MADTIWSDVYRHIAEATWSTSLSIDRRMAGAIIMVFSQRMNGRSNFVDVMLSTVQRPKYGGSHMV
ncbi:hypothetical protein DPMN_051934 [Dreissena polymorpha]|uniref:Uncharacterized protein n=1 Tax=Dreissena polymorpha TaxID=45954 RepID=A0A9D4CIR8_DREPO|nr:hypothetical protein DPMN_051934 [Dreissena polymorpha]